MSVEDKAKELGQAIIEDERYISYEKARLIHDNDEELQAMLVRYDTIRNDLVTENQKGIKDNAKLENLSNAMQVLYDQIIKNENMLSFLNAKNEMEKLMNEVNSIIDFYITGEEGGCSPDKCSGCSGCH
ncbi:MAG: YlbF family regulator [Bacillota bacterium]|nr:YlbF family regulator [Bacillota bacterium]